MELKDFFAAHPRAALAFSGGADSAYLLWAGRQWARELGVYCVRSAFQPDFELRDAQRLAAALGAELRVIEADVLGCEEIVRNAPDRCYHCKHRVFSLICEQARRDGYPVVIDGTNADDPAEDRPGMRALEEMGVLSPLRLCGLKKSDVRARSREIGLFTADKPAYACLATRVRVGERITADTLRRVERSEEQLFDMGYSDFRVRTAGGRATLQLVEGQWERGREELEEIRHRLAPYFACVELDETRREKSR